MQGTIVKVAVEEGQQVEVGDLVVVLEAMKMEHHVAAPFDAAVAEVRVAVGEQVENGALLVALDQA